MTNINWTVNEFIGIEIYHSKEDAEADRKMLEPPKVGDEILCPTFSGWAKAIVKQDQHGLYAEAGKFVWPLAHSEDSRNCWIASGAINMAAIKKLDLRK